MALIYIAEPAPTAGAGAMSALLLSSALRRAGHTVVLIKLTKRGEVGNETRVLFAADVKSVVDPATLATPDAWFVSCIYTRQWTELPAFFDRIGVAARPDMRRPTDPLIAIGGQVTISPEPAAGFADVLALGDGEVTGVLLAEYLDQGLKRLDVMREVDGMDGFFVPMFHDDPDNLPAFRRVEGAELFPIVTRDSDNASASTIELARGCASKCSFCPIGWAGGRYREAPRQKIVDALRLLRGKQVNLFAPDYSSVSWVDNAEELMEKYGCSPKGRDARLDAANRHLRAGTGVKVYSFGIEGMSERLRRAIGKPLSHEKIIETMDLLHKAGVGTTKWYIIVGLPGETDEDCDEFLRLLKDVRKVYPRFLEWTVTHFQSVPHTPLQWVDNHYRPDAYDRCQRIISTTTSWYRVDGIKHVSNTMKGRELHEHDAFLQRAPRATFQYLMRLRGSQSKIRDGRWRGLAADAGLDIDKILSEIPVSATTPWSHVDVGVPKENVMRAWSSYWQRFEGKSRDANLPAAHPALEIKP